MHSIVSESLSVVNSVSLALLLSVEPCNPWMKVIEEIRRLRLQQLKQEFGSYAALNELMGRKRIDATLSQLANRSPESSTGKSRGMGSPQARALEQACKKEVGWMDTDPDLISLPGFEQLDLDKRQELTDLFTKFVEGELAKQAMKIIRKDDEPVGAPDDISHRRPRKARP